MDRNFIVTDEAKRLKLIRKDNKLTQKDLGDLLGKTQGTVQKYESGELFIPIEVFKDIHDSLNYSYEWLLNGKTPKFNVPEKDNLMKDVSYLVQKIELLEERYNDLSKKLNKVVRDYYGDKKVKKLKN